MDQAIDTPTGRFGDASPPAAGQKTPPAKGASDEADLEQSMESRHLYAGREWGTDHSLNIRVSIPLGIGRYYITLVAGKERRARARLALDRRQNPLDTPGNVFFLAFITIIATAGSLTLFYLILAHIFDWSGRLVL